MASKKKIIDHNDNQTIIPLKVFLLLRNVHNNPHKENIIQILNKAYSFAESERMTNSISTHAVIFYALANCELYRKLNDNIKMLEFRNTTKVLCTDETYQNYIDIVNLSTKLPVTEDITKGMTLLGDSDHSAVSNAYEGIIREYFLMKDFDGSDYDTFLWKITLIDMLKHHFTQSQVETIMIISKQKVKN